MRISDKRILAIVFIVIAAAIGLFVYSNGQLKYSPKGTNNIAGPIVIKAKEKINPSSGAYTIDPSVEGNMQIIDNYIIFWPEEDGGFVFDTEYTARFSGYTTESGNNIKTVETTFKISKKADYSKLQKEVLTKYGVFEQSVNPFLEKLPHTEDYRYKITYVINQPEDGSRATTTELLGDADNWREKKENYSVIIETLVIQGRDESYESYVQEVREARQEALDWISAQDVDINSDIIYVFIPDDKTLLSPNTSKEDTTVEELDDF